MYRSIIVVMTVLLCCSSAAAEEPAISKGWYSPVELLTKLAERDGLEWAVPETLSGRALVKGGHASVASLLDDACRQWKLAWSRSNGVVVVHLPNDARLGTLTEALRKGDATAAWELGWLRDARALPVLAEALASKDVAVALAAAQAIEVLETPIPLGRDERVEPLARGRVSLAKAFPAKTDLRPQLNAPYPPVRAAAARMLLAAEDDLAREATEQLQRDKSAPARRARMQWLVSPGPLQREARFVNDLPPVPGDDDAVKAACAKLIAELPALEKQSAWEQMQWRVETMAEWSRRGEPEATTALLSLCTTKIQHGWFPGFVQRHTAMTASPETVTKLVSLFPMADRASLVRGLEQTIYGEQLFAVLRPHLSEPTLCYVAARKAGREVHDDFLELAGKGNFAAIDALGVIGGPRAVAVLSSQLEREGDHASTIHFRSAKALARCGTPDALAALLAATRSDDRLLRHAGALFAGQIGGPEAVKRLQALLTDDDDRMVRAAAADALEQIGDPASIAAIAAFRAADKALPSATYRPRNKRFDETFPVNEWVNLKISIEAFAEFGEIGWNYDAANRLFFRYGGCSGYTNELTVFDLGTERFQQRRPNEEMAGWGDRRPARGCSGGRCFDPHLKTAWIGPVIGGGDADLAIAEYYNRGGQFRLASYDLATDRFQAAAYTERVYGEPSKRYAYDWQRGLLIPVKFSPFPEEKPFWVLNTRATDPYGGDAWLNKMTRDDYPRDPSYATAAVDQDAGLLVLYVPPRDKRPVQTWTYEAAANTWKNVSPSLQPEAQAGAGFVYDPFHKRLLLQSGRHVSQYDGPDDSLTWTYDVRTNTWTDLKPKGGPGNPWVGAMDFDPEHNVFVLFNYRDKQVWAYRYAQVAEGFTAK
jgi:HEAT repeat protein